MENQQSSLDVLLCWTSHCKTKTNCLKVYNEKNISFVIHHEAGNNLSHLPCDKLLFSWIAYKDGHKVSMN